ncbi:polysaccharide pyruvyl transferase family protein [Pseudomonas sp. A-1]|nr:polysaccharide pyruvyl transferase family protein [Pseudomonas sp. A-1]
MTQPLGTNYGGIMQAWALQQVLKRMGHNPVTIDRQPDAKGLAYHAARLGYRTLQKALGKRKAPINFERHLPTILQHTRAFIDQNLSISEPLGSTAKLKAHFVREEYDAVIVGSDQTWRPQYSPNIENFFLDFLEGFEIKRIAYASSFGVDEWEFTEEQTRRCAALAKRFDSISVREDSGVELCRKHLGVEASHVLDPTLLLDKADYQQLIGPERLSSKPYGVYTYFLDKTPAKQTLAQQASEQLDEPVYSCQARLSVTDEFQGSLDSFIMPSCLDWLAGFANCRYVVTDSFHGMVFSIIFGKPFFVIRNEGRGQARIESLSRSFECEKLLSNKKMPFKNEKFILEEAPKNLTEKLNSASYFGINFLKHSTTNN